MIKKYCKMCKTNEVINKRIYCSNECKFSDSNYNKSRSSTIKNDQTKCARCKIDGKILNDEKNLGGHLSTYSEKHLNIPFNWDDWEIIDKLKEERWNCPHCTWSGKTKNGKDNGGWVSKHLLQIHGITKDIHNKQFPNDDLWSHSLKKIERKKTIDEHEDNRIECLECNEYFIRITNSHLRDKHNGMTEFEYIAKHGLDSLSCQSFRNWARENYLKNDKMQSTFSRSKPEQDICDLLTEWNIPYKPNSKELGFDIDIYIPEYKLAIEFNGLYWHSELSGGKLEHYHLNKTLLCEEKGIKLIHIFEDEWLFKKDIVISRIKNELKLNTNTIYARKCEIKELSFTEINKFLDDNHLQGQGDPTSLNFGLYYNLELVSLMSFKRGRKENEIELKRFCSKINTNVVGAANKLLKYFERQYHPTKLFSYADRRWTDLLSKSVYDLLGFTLVSHGQPNYWYLVYPNKRSHRLNFTKSNIIKLFKNSDDKLTEWENMNLLGYDRIWDCGSLKYEKVYDNSDIVQSFKQIITHKKIKQRKVKRNKKQTVRNIIDVKCNLCGNEYSINGFNNHLKLCHKLTVNEYISVHGEYRPKHINENNKRNNLIEKFICLECNQDNFYSHKSYIQHINKQHDGGWEGYAIKYFFNNIRPTCQCGCNKNVKIITKPPYRLNFISGHNLRNKI